MLLATKRAARQFIKKTLLASLVGVVLHGAVLFGPGQASAAITSIEPITWNVIGLDSNSPMAGPNRFPVGARVCSTTVETGFPVTLFWETANPYIELTDSSPNPVRIDIPAGGCADAYFEVAVQRTSAAFETARGYYISAGGLTTPRPRELYVKKLVSQGRNGIINLEYGTSLSNLASMPVGGSFSLIKGETYYIRMSSYTAPGGYEQLETFSTLPNTIFQVLSVNTTYTADTTTNVSSPHDQLYADACYWEDDPNDPNYMACNDSGKIGGSMTITYQVKIIDVVASAQPIYSLIYDLSGASYHYNSDYASGARNVFLVDPELVTINKRFSPGTITSGGVSTLSLTLTNPNSGTVSGIDVTDDLTSVVVTPAGGVMAVADPLVVTNTCGGDLLDANGNNLAAGATGLALTGASVPGYGSCSIILQVTADLEGTYENTADLSIADFTTSAVASLTVDDTTIPRPMPPSSCPGEEIILASWNFDNLTAGQPIPADNNFSFKAEDVDFASASFFLSGGTGGNTITTAQSVSSPNAWSGSGWNITAQGAPTLGNTHFRFDVDSSNYGGIFIELRARINANGNWTGTNNNLRLWRNGSLLAPDDTGLRTTFDAYTRPAASNYRPETSFAVQGYYAKTNDVAIAALYLDDVVIKGCAFIDTDPPTIAKEFVPATIAVGGASTLTFTITDPADDGQPLSGVAFTDELPANLQVASPLTTSNTCGGSLTDAAGANLAAGATGIRLTGGSLANGGSCQVAVNVTTSVSGLYDNVSGYVTSLYSGANTDPATGIARATLTALLPPTIEKTFSPSQIFTTAFNGLSTLTFTVTNPNPDHAMVGVAFSDEFPGDAPDDVVVADPPVATTSGCGAPVYTPVAGSGEISFSGGTLVAGGVCVVSVDVESATAGYFENTSGAVSHLLDDAVLGTDYPFGADTAYAVLLVEEPTSDLSLLKQIGPGADGPWGSGLIVPTGADVYYHFIVENIGDTALSDIALSDPLVSTATCTWPLVLPVADAHDDDHVATCVVGPITAQAGTHSNTAYATGVYDGTSYVSGESTATYATSDLTLVKSAVEALFNEEGDTLTYSYAVTNAGGASLIGPVTVTDNRIAEVACPALTTVGNNDAYLDDGETLVCTGSYRVTAADIANRQVVNIARAVIDSVPSPTASASVAIGAPLLTILKSANLANASPGDTIVYTVQIHNTGNGLATSVVLKDRLSPYAAFKLDFDDTVPSAEPFVFTDTTAAPDVSDLSLGTPEYSSENGGEAWTYTPVDRGDGHDDKVTNWRIPMNGTLNPGGSISLQYKVIVK
ncbi:MAG: DUF11 domain-containing protein [Desulfuromonadaceae bacterium]|nr:DUF11 domain-containing protein [Desulfuromonadaceae bacterium]